MLSKINALKHVNEYDKQILIDIINHKNNKKINDLSFISKKGKFKIIDDHKVNYFNEEVISINLVFYTLFIDNEKKIILQSSYQFYHLSILIDIIDAILILINNLIINNLNVVNDNIIYCEKWFNTYGHLLDEIYKIYDFKLNYYNYYNNYKISFHIPEKTKLNYSNNNIFKIINLLQPDKNYINLQYLSTTKFKSAIFLQHQFNDLTFHKFPKNMTNLIIKLIDSKNIKNQNIFITRNIARHLPRNLKNQIEIENYFKNINYNIINPENVDILEFITEIQNVSNVILTWGGALTNMVFLKPKCNVYILKSESYMDENINLFKKIIDAYELNVKVIESINNEINPEIILL
jgi:hypothetical protein